MRHTVSDCVPFEPNSKLNGVEHWVEGEFLGVSTDSEWAESRMAVALISFSARLSHASKNDDVLPSTVTNITN